MPKLYGGSGTIGYAGKTYTPADDGSVEVPAELVHILLEQGFCRQPRKPEERPLAEQVAELRTKLIAAEKRGDELSEQVKALEAQLEQATAPPKKAARG